MLSGSITVFWLCFLGLFLGFGGLALAEGPAKGQNQGFVRYDLGEIEIYPLVDGTGQLSFDFFRDIDRQKLIYLAKSKGLKTDYFPSWINAFLVRMDNKLILVDTGKGQVFGDSGQIVESIKAAGFSPDDIDLILLTHFHGDHIGGLLDSLGQPAFAKAVVMAEAREDAFWLIENVKTTGALAERVMSLYRLGGRYKIFKAGEELAPGISSLALYGHTPGHVGFLFKTDTRAFLAWGDIVHSYLVQFEHPEITLSYDVDSLQAAETRREILERASYEGYLIGGAHLPFPALGHVTAVDAGFEWQPVVIGEQ